MRNARKLLTVTTGGVLGIGLMFIAASLLSSLAPSEAAKSQAEILVKKSLLDDVDYVEADLYGRKALVVAGKPAKIFAVPYSNGVYWLPDPTWQRAAYRCRNFRLNNEVFQCGDLGMAEWWAKNLVWDKSGKNIEGKLPDLIPVRFKEQGDYISINASGS